MTSLILSGKNGGPKSGEELLRQDTAGRVRTSAERRALLLAQFDRSGVSGARFAKMAGIKYQTFANWLHVRRRQTQGTARPAKGRRAVTWIEAVPRAVDSLRVELPGGAWMELSSAAQLRTAALLLRELSGPGAKSC
jgi:hypothetical protein